MNDDQLLADYHADAIHFWRTQDGRRLVPAQFQTDHLVNTIKHIEAQYEMRSAADRAFRRSWPELAYLRHPRLRPIEQLSPILPGLRGELRIRVTVLARQLGRAITAL